MINLIYCKVLCWNPIVLWIMLCYDLSLASSYSSPSSSASLSYAATSTSTIGEAKVDIELFHANRLILKKTMNIPLTKVIPSIHYRQRRDLESANTDSDYEELMREKETLAKRKELLLKNYRFRHDKKLKANRKRLSQRNISAYSGARRPGRVGINSMPNGKVAEDYNMRNRGARGSPSTSTINYVYRGILIHVVRATKSVKTSVKPTNTSGTNKTTVPPDNSKNESEFSNTQNIHHDGCISRSSPLLNDINKLLDDNHDSNWIALVQNRNLQSSPPVCQNPEVRLFDSVKPAPTVVILYGSPTSSYKQSIQPRGSSRRLYTGSSNPFNKKRMDSNSWTGRNRQFYRDTGDVLDSNLPNLYIREDASKDSQVILSIPWGDSKQILDKCRYSTGPLISNQKRSSKLRSNQNWLPIKNNPKFPYEVCKIYINIQSSSEENFLNKTSVLFVSVSFILLMVISLAWLMFYYVQRFRYIHTKEQFSRRLANMAKKAVAKIPVKTLKPGDKETDPELDNCAICIEHYNPSDTVRILPCKHYFHKSCIDPWLLEQRSCPMCKLNILQAYGFLTTTTSSSNSTNSGNGLPTNSVSIVNDNGAVGVTGGSIRPTLSVSNISTTNNSNQNNTNTKNLDNSHVVDDEQISEIFLAPTPTNVVDQSPSVLKALATQHSSITNVTKQPKHHQYSVGNLQSNYPTVAMVAYQPSGSHGDIGCYDSHSPMETKVAPYSLLFSNKQQPEQYNTVAMVSSLPGDVDVDDCHGYKDSSSLSPNHNEDSVRLLSSIHGNTTTSNNIDNTTNNKSNSLRHLALYHRAASSSSSSSNTSLDHSVNQSNSITNQNFCLPHSSIKPDNSKVSSRCHANRSSMGVVERPTSLYSLPGTLHKASSIKSMIVVKETNNSMVTKVPSLTEAIMSSFKIKQNNKNSYNNDEV